jgi:hypothetical protein
LALPSVFLAGKNKRITEVSFFGLFGQVEQRIILDTFFSIFPIFFFFIFFGLFRGEEATYQ